jgi:hypothetical protein
MRSVRTVWMALAIGAVGVGIAGCNGSGTYVPIGAGSAVDGEWAGTDGATLTRFSSGNFLTTFVGTGETLATGTYQMVDARTVRIAMHSVVRQTDSSVDCTLVSASSLSCTGADGRQFGLVRRA